MSEPAEQPQLKPLKPLLGTWTVEATHPMFEGKVIPGHATFEWLEGERFLLQRSHTEHPDFPDSLSVIGMTDDEPSMHYFDSRGVFRVYGWRFEGSTWKMWRDAPGFSQRFTGAFENGGNTIAGLWQLSGDDATWNDDLAITFRRDS